MVSTTSERLPIDQHPSKSESGSLGLDRKVTLEINGTKQRVRFCSARKGLPPVLIVQAGPGFPLLHEVTKFQQRLRLEQNFSVAYWDQRGCGNAATRDAHSVSLGSQVDDLCAVVRWLAKETKQQVLLVGISIGATIALQMLARNLGIIKALVAVSIDTDIQASDLAVYDFLKKAGTRIAQKVQKLGPPPYTTPAPLQLRARLLTDLGGIEHGKRSGELLRELMFGLIRTYGLLGTVATMRNMNAIQRKILPELASLNLFANWPRTTIPVHYIFGSDDPLNPPSLVQKVSSVIQSGDTLVTLPEAGHMLHFDHPAEVRSVITQAYSTS